MLPSLVSVPGSSDHLQVLSVNALSLNINEPFNECRREEGERGVERAGATEQRIGSEWFYGVSCRWFPQSPWLLRKLNSVVLTESRQRK